MTGRPPLGRRDPARRGSVLVPLVAAMLIMLLAGVALAELFGAQRMQSLHGVQASQAYWIAEAGAWHAALEDDSITTPVSFAGGSYTVSKAGDEYTSTGEKLAARRVVTRAITAAGSGGGGGGGGEPLDEVASAATAARQNHKRATLDLVSITSSDVEISTFSLSADQSTEKLKRLRLDGKQIYKKNSGLNLPTGTVALNKGSSSHRTVPAMESPELRIEFKHSPDDDITYTLVLNFTDGSSETIVFTIEW